MNLTDPFLQKRRRANGEFSQNLVHQELRRRGYKLVEPVFSPWRVIRSGNRIVNAFPLTKVSGDFRAVGSGGRSVLVEVKGREEGNLSFSVFAPHQRAALDEHADAGGLTLIAWVRDIGIRWFEWPIPGFKPGTSLKWNQNSKSEDER